MQDVLALSSRLTSSGMAHKSLTSSFTFWLLRHKAA